MKEKEEYLLKMNCNLEQLQQRKNELVSFMKQCSNNKDKMNSLLDAYNSITKVLNMVSLSFAISAVLTDMQEHPNDLADKVFVTNVTEKFYSVDYIPKELKEFAKDYLIDILSGKLNPIEIVDEAKLIENTLLNITYKGV